MKICFISREFPPGNHVGGIGTYTHTAANLLVNQGHEVHVITYGPFGKKDKKGSLIVHTIPMLPHPLPSAKWLFYYRHAFRSLLPVYLDMKTWALTAMNYYKQLSIENFDIIEYPETMGEGSFIAIKKQSMNISCNINTRLICRIHSSPLTAIAKNFLEKKLVRRLERKSCLLADRVVSPSKYIADSYGKKALNLHTPIMVSRNPIALWPQAIDWGIKKTSNVLFVGRIEYLKGIHLLCKALEALPPNIMQKISLRIIGNCYSPANKLDHLSQNTLNSYLQKHSLYSYNANDHNSQIHSETTGYLGPVPHNKLSRYYDWAGLFILPSLEENYPYVLLEALSRGCYVIAANVGGIPEIINSKEKGLLFNKGDSSALAQQISTYFNQPPELKDLQELSTKTQAAFSEKKCFSTQLKSYTF
ncbi:MAG: glycosyltransferase family 4 protein [Fibrobacteria bacterium]|nr:glycosyltransferase family 4 protein [Fibrobacteria bacterium]